METTSPIEAMPQDEELLALLSACGLPVSDLSPAGGVHFLGCRAGGALAGVVGLELHGRAGLLRSLAVAPAHRGHGLGAALTIHAEEQARRLGIETLYLLTTTAAGFFTRLGYSAADRRDAPVGIRQSAQFCGLCPVSSSFMGKCLLDRG